MCLEIWEISAVAAAVHQGQHLQKQAALEQQCRFEAASLDGLLLSAGWLSVRTVAVLMSSCPVREAAQMPTEHASRCLCGC